MTRYQIIERVRGKLAQLDIPEHSWGISKIPSKVELRVAIGPATKVITLRAGALAYEVEAAMHELGYWWSITKDQVDIEDVTGKIDGQSG